MKNILVLFGVIFFITLLSFDLVLSGVQFYQVKQDRGNGTIRNRISMLYQKEGFYDLNFNQLTNDYVLGKSPFECYIQYSFNVQSSNLLNINNQVNYCNLKIWVWKHLEPNQTLVFEKNFTESMPDTTNAQYFFQLYDGDQAISQQECYFVNRTSYPFDFPADMQMIQPTSQCKSCQFYLWSKQEADISKAQIIGNNFVLISNYVQRLVILNFEIIIVLFWVLIILSLFIAVGLIFMGGYWIFLYLWQVIK